MAAETGKSQKEHSFTVTGNIGPGGGKRLALADAGVWRITLGNYAEEIPITSLVVKGDGIAFNSTVKKKVGITQFVYNTRTGFFGVAWKLVPAEGPQLSGMALSNSTVARADMALSFDLDVQGGKFQTSAYVRLRRDKAGAKKWTIR